MTLTVTFFVCTWSDSCSVVLGVIAEGKGGNAKCFTQSAGMQHFIMGHNRATSL